MSRTADGEWSGDIFDPRAVRHFSILPEADADEGYCVRHDREMLTLDPFVHTQGAIYTTADGFSVYTCPSCLRDVGDLVDGVPDDTDAKDVGIAAYRRALGDAFDQWDRGDAHADWFTYVGEGSVEGLDDDHTLLTFDESPGGDWP